MALETYRKKRNFSVTPEPQGRRAPRTGNSFVIQKHDATRLHYDFRLEMDGVLKSWAVTKGPSLIPGEKRLAVHVEDHPLEYGNFEGTIPKGEYGGGTVLLWDRGTWTPIGDAHRGYAKGHLDFELHGEKLGGRWHLVRMAGKPREKRENWLLIKGDDDAARTERDPDILDERPESVATGRKIDDVAGEEPGWSSKTGRIRRRRGGSTRPAPAEEAPATVSVPEPSKIKGAKKAALPDFVEPTLATLVSSAPSGERWLHEIKFDGYRLQARIEAGRVKLLTRSGLDWTKKFGKAVVSALADIPVGTALIDGELVVETSAGASDFSALQADLSEGRSDRFHFYVFDLLHLDGYDLRDVALIKRKELLEKIIGSNSGIISYSGHFEEDGVLVLRHACRLSLEGIVSKLRDAPYRAGRSKNWVKSKCSARQEFVVAGFIPSTTSRKAIGSLVLGVYDHGKLHHVGRVGTGYTAAVAESLFKKLERMRVPSSPFDERLSAEEARQVRYVRPDLVAEVEFRAWTADGNLRHASFRGLREDKPAKEIVRETPKTSKAAPQPQRRTVKLTHPDRLYWPDEGVTKEGLADYYAEVWRYASPYIVGRALALVRCPNGISGEQFFQKHAWKGLNPNIVLVHDPKDPPDERLISINDLDGLIGLVQSAALEIHPWGSTVSDWERPDTIIMDLDPGEGVSWEAVIEGAVETRDRLKDAGLVPFIKTSGGKGLHVVAPLKPKAEWPEVKAFTKAIADSMAADSPNRYVSTITKSKRRGKILVDYLRNQRGATAVAAYSTRARPGAAVSMPLAWDELGPSIGPAYFTVENTPTRLASLSSDPWQDFHAAAAPIEDRAKRRKKAA
ncbi:MULTISPECIES: DNA ligase D [unclassified Mesorhizobium]|uniref:DNA ligase D n=1 Tax=Mesorhizobium TaxID=68287 RepID=UPI0004836E85|nr:MULTISPECIES: DNA ligase D [unclassified Mesorhizobium]RWO08661.1 MAG: DNA ligase D [Mesorhizobium sp.]RWO21491.1 MAG: DNA ligase D [Mesorhizobium sp.]RWQ01527.1 MAG: DNA ligase D [Mesorhizobium sp.]TIL29090.1 MAG: DNA ligase D [Mesorhizobium sp.]TIL52677.1 MAG: DNA ligase D [Mesorhizobium sp.]